MEGEGALQRPADACLPIGVLDRPEVDNMKIPDESDVTPAPPGCNFKAMLPGDGYSKLVREKEEERARQVRETVLVQANNSTDAGASANATAACRNEGNAVAPEMDPSNADISNLSSRDVDDSRALQWLPNHRIHDISETKLQPMRYTLCDLGDNCNHYPSSMLQIYDVLINFHTGGPYFMVMRNNILCSAIEVYGFLATRDIQDFSRNYIFHRTRENPQAVNVNGGYLRLRNPARGISAMSCLLEIDIRIKAEHVDDDCKIVTGSVASLWEFDTWNIHHVDGMDGRITFESSVVSRGVEAAINLDFFDVPACGFHMRMCGNTVRSKRLYYFTDECRRDCDGFIASPGKYEQTFIAAVSKGDTLRIDFMEGLEVLSFVAAKHGNEQQSYGFRNGAVVSVQVYWSTVEPVDDNVTE